MIYWKKTVTPELVDEMQKDRENGLLMREIAARHHLSLSTVQRLTTPPDSQNRVIYNYNYITKEEIAIMRRNLRLGSVVDLKNTEIGPSMEKTEQPGKREPCTVMAKYNYVVVFRRPNGKECSRTYVELCQKARGIEI